MGGLFGSHQKELEPYSFGKSDDSRQNSYSSESSVDDDYEACYEIDFWHPNNKLIKNVIAFKIRDESAEVVGYAIASSIDSFDILGTAFGELSEEDMNYLKRQLQNFCKVYYHENKGTDENT